MEMEEKKLKHHLYECLNKYVHFVKNVDYNISRNLIDAGIETRPAKTNGIWCCMLLPLILLLNTIQYNVTTPALFAAYVSVGLFFYCLLFLLFLYVSCMVLQEEIYGGCVASGFTSALLVYIFLEKSFIISVIFTLPSVCLFAFLLRYSLTKYPKTFTIGEAMIVCQIVVLFGLMIVTRVVYNADYSLLEAVLFIAWLTVALIVTTLYFMEETARNLVNLMYVFGAGVLFALIILHSLLGANGLIEIIYFIFSDWNRVRLFLFWLCLVLISAAVLVSRTGLAVKASTVARKAFHVFASLVFLSGILFDVQLMALAAGCGLGLLVLVEALRKSRIEPVSSCLQSAFEVYSDEKDVGSFAMTPIYLFVGLACPLVLVPDSEWRLELAAGVLALGVGDTAASWFGCRYGFNRWPDSSRTLEGTTFNVLTQIFTVYMLTVFGLLETNHAMLRTTVAAMASGWVEAKTDQVDNLILPFVTLLAFQATWFLR